MSKMLKVITAYFVLPASFLCASSQEMPDEKQNDYCCVENSFGYLNIGAAKSILEFDFFLGLGYRKKKIIMDWMYLDLLVISRAKQQLV